MEGLTSLVSESLARHGFDRPLDYRRLKWSRWFRCESHHSLLFVPSKPGVFAVAEEILSVGTDAFVRPASGASVPRVGTAPSAVQQSGASVADNAAYQGAASALPSIDANGTAALAAPDAGSRKPETRSRMLAVSQFFEADDMAYVLDRMLSRQHPMRSRLESGHYFIRFVVIEEDSQRRSIASALNQWIANSAEKATGIGPHFATSLELAPSSDQNEAAIGAISFPASGASVSAATHSATPPATSGAATNINCPSPFPSGF